MPDDRRPTLAGFTDDELHAEMVRRSNLVPPPPRMKTPPDIDALRETVKSCVESAVANRCWGKDSKQYVYEATMQAFYGREFWAWHNSVKWEGE